MIKLVSISITFAVYCTRSKGKIEKSHFFSSSSKTKNCFFCFHNILMGMEDFFCVLLKNNLNQIYIRTREFTAEQEK